MLRTSAKLRMHTTLVMAAMLVVSAVRPHGQDLSGKAIVPGVGGQVHAFAFD